MIVEPVTLRPGDLVADALELMERYRISGVPDHRRGGASSSGSSRPGPPLRDAHDAAGLRADDARDLVTAPVGTTLEEAGDPPSQQDREAADRRATGGSRASSPSRTSRRSSTRTRRRTTRGGCGSAPRSASGRTRSSGRPRSSTRGGRARRRPGHGHSHGVLDVVRRIRSAHDVQLIAGNVSTGEGARSPTPGRCREDRPRPWEHLHDPHRRRRRRAAGDRGLRRRAGARRPDVPVIADGGCTNSGRHRQGDRAGADVVMLGSMLAGTDEAPGE